MYPADGKKIIYYPICTYSIDNNIIICFAIMTNKTANGEQQTNIILNVMLILRIGNKI